MNFIYHKIKNDNFNLIKSGKKIIDRKLNSPNDCDYCIALYSIFDNNTFNSQFHSLFTDLKIKFPNQLIYDDLNAFLHNTVLQIISFNEYNDNFIFFMLNKDKYISIIKKHFRYLNIFKIYFKGIIPTPSGIILCGFPNININLWRENLRNDIISNNLVIKEPYHNNIMHSTLLRFNNDIDMNHVIDFCNKYENTYFGFTEINHYTLAHSTIRLFSEDVKIEQVFNLV